MRRQSLHINASRAIEIPLVCVAEDRTAPARMIKPSMLYISKRSTQTHPIKHVHTVPVSMSCVYKYVCPGSGSPAVHNTLPYLIGWHTARPIIASEASRPSRPMLCASSGSGPCHACVAVQQVSCNLACRMHSLGSAVLQGNPGARPAGKKQVPWRRGCLGARGAGCSECMHVECVTCHSCSHLTHKPGMGLHGARGAA